MMPLPDPVQCQHTWTWQSVCRETLQYIRHPSASVCKLSGRQTVGRSITTVDRSLISRGISSYSRSRTNKLSPNTGFAWQWGCLWMCVYAYGGACIHQTETVGQYWGMENQHAILKERLMLEHHSARCRARAFPEARIAISHLLH